MIEESIVQDGIQIAHIAHEVRPIAPRIGDHTDVPLYAQPLG